MCDTAAKDGRTEKETLKATALLIITLSHTGTQKYFTPNQKYAVFSVVQRACAEQQKQIKQTNQTNNKQTTHSLTLESQIVQKI